MITIKINSNHKIPENITSELIEQFDNINVKDALVLVRIKGTLESGKISEIDYKKAYDVAYDKGAYFVMRNTTKLETREYEEIKIETGKDIETELINEHVGQINVTNWDKDIEKSMIRQLMTVLSADKKDGEKVYEFENRIMLELKELLRV